MWPVEKHLGTFQTRFAGTAALPGGTSVNIPGLAAPSLLPARDFGGYGGCGAFPGRERLVSASSQPRSLARRHGAAPPFAFCRIKNVEASGIRRLAASLRRRNGFHEALNPSPTPPPQKWWGKKWPPAAWVGLGPLRIAQALRNWGGPWGKILFWRFYLEQQQHLAASEPAEGEETSPGPCPVPGCCFEPSPWDPSGAGSWGPAPGEGVQEGFGGLGLLRATPEAGRGMPGGSRACPGASGVLRRCWDGAAPAGHQGMEKGILAAP